MDNLRPRYSASEILRLMRQKSESFWLKKGEETTLKVFHEAARRVPAYKDFLKKNKIAPSKIKTFKDFQFVQPVNKKNYLHQYSLEKLCWDGTLKKPLVFAATSGSTGKPFYFPRSDVLEWQSSINHELFLNYQLNRHRQSTLVVVCFGMGIWIGGLITYQAFRLLADRGYPVSIITPGVNKKEIFESLKNLVKKFDQVILCGYPPFIKDIIDEGRERGINWKDFRLKIIFAAESFSEKFRNYIAERVGLGNPYLETMNIYGTVDLGTMAEETPLSIYIRKAAVSNQLLYTTIFGNVEPAPTLVQFNPLFVNFEAVDGNVLATGNNALPLIRYAIGDRGRLLTFGKMSEIFEEYGLPLRKAARQFKFAETISEQPFLYIHERTDFAVKLYGAIIYPGPIREALQDRKVNRLVTGKFTMTTKFDARHNEFLEINIELKRHRRPSKHLYHLCRSSVIKALLKKNAEYRNNYHALSERVAPKIVFWPHEHPLYFSQGTKQKWVKND